MQTRTVLTSLPPATNPATVLRLVRGHGRIENRLHDVRDVTMGEDRSRWRAVPVPTSAAARLTLARQRAALHPLG